MELVISEKRTTKISSDLPGIFFEDINYGADGGIYAEMIENRSFEFLDCFGDKGDYYTIFDGGYGWSPYPGEREAGLQVVMGSPVSEENPHYLRVTVRQAGAGFANKAYRGITLQKGAAYRVVFYARAVSYLGRLTVKVVKDGRLYAENSVSMAAEEVVHDWHRYELELTAREDVKGALFVITLDKEGTAEFDFVSMIPGDAVAGAFRKDAFEALKALKPAFMRFPGGCVVEGNTMSNRYRFKDTLKRPEDRKSNWNRWAVHDNNEENGYHGIYSHYNQTLGLGYYEFFVLCELLGAKALPIMNVGMACQYQSYEYMPIDSPEFEQMVQDALDLIEFANGSEETVWGAVRAGMGHPQPFGLEYLGIGNEQWQVDCTDFFARYRIFEKRIHERYPQIKLIGSAGPDVTSSHYTDAWRFYREEIRKNPDFVYAVDEHYYMKPQWFLENNTFYDDYPRDIRVFAGEYAAHDPEVPGKGIERNNFGAALSEAAFLTGVERNGDVVALSSYAPLFSRQGYVQWGPDLIWMDEENVVKTPSFYVQQLYSQYRGDCNLDTLGQEKTLRRQGIYYNACCDAAGRAILKLVNTSDEDAVFELRTEDARACRAERRISLRGERKGYNSFECPGAVVPKEESCEGSEICVAAGEFVVVLLAK